MIQSQELGELATALANAQSAFEVVAKSADNPFFRSRYAALPDVVKAATPILAENGLSVSQLIGRDADGDTLTTMLLHKSGQYLGSSMQMRPVKNDPQAQGSAATYARRYSYMAILGLVADEDDDGNAGSAPRPRQKAAPARKPERKPAWQPEKTEKTVSAEEVARGLGADLVDEDTLKQISAAAKKRWPDRDTMRDKLKWELIGIEGVEFDPNETDPQLLNRVMASLSVAQAVELLKRVEEGAES